MTDWTIYRDGVAYRVNTASIFDALTELPDEGPLPLVGPIPSTERELVGAWRVCSLYADDRRVDLVYKLGATVYVLERVEEVDLFTAVLAWSGARREYKSTSGKPPPSGEAARAAYFARVEGATNLLGRSRDVLDVADPAWTRLDPNDATELRALLEEKGCQARNAIGVKHVAAIERALSCVESVAEVGMEVGCPVTVLRSGFDDDPYAGPGVVIDVHPIETTRDARYHSREVRLNSGARVATSVRRLELS